MIKLLTTVVSLACVAACQAVADEAEKDVRDMKLFRFEFDNDTFARLRRRVQRGLEFSSPLGDARRMDAGARRLGRPLPDARRRRRRRADRAFGLGELRS